MDEIKNKALTDEELAQVSGGVAPVEVRNGLLAP